MARRKIDLDALPSNNRSTPDDVNIELEGRVRTKPKGGITYRLRDIGNSLFGEIVIPTLKDGLLAFLNEGAERLIRGEPKGTAAVRKPKVHRRTYNAPYRNVQRRSTSMSSYERRVPNRIQRVFEDIYFETRQDAELVLGKMMEFVAEYGWITVGELHSWLGLPSDYAHENWGWTELHGTRVLFTTEGYVIDLREPVYFK